jgi:hypothetical protein
MVSLKFLLASWKDRTSGKERVYCKPYQYLRAATNEDFCGNLKWPSIYEVILSLYF